MDKSKSFLLQLALVTQHAITAHDNGRNEDALHILQAAEYNLHRAVEELQKIVK